MDLITPERRSENMRRIRSTGMKPEIAVRSLVHRLGCRFRLHDNNLPGKPDIVLPSRRKVILVHGCFWHQHSNKTCKITRKPKSNLSYWGRKLARNVARDRENVKALSRLGWKVLTVWECETRKPEKLVKRLEKFLNGVIAAN